MRKSLQSLLFICCLLPLGLYAQQTSSPQQTIKVGIKVTPPFIVEDNGQYKGLSIQSWEMINDELGLDYEYVSFSTIEGLLNAVENNEVDMSINPITVTYQRMQTIDFSQPYFISETVTAKKESAGFIYFIKNILSWDFIKALSALVAIIFIFGFLVWIFERKKNKEEFGGKLKGLAQGFWWSAVTMTTVGYGDKSPQTLGGRIVGFVWMFAAIIMISSLTAGIASSLTAQSLKGNIQNINDLSQMKVVTVGGSSAAELLKQYGIKTKEVDFLADGISMIEDDQAEVIVYDKPILKHEIDAQDLEDEILISDVSFKKDYYSYSFPKNSTLLKKIDAQLIAILKTNEWNTITSKQ